MARWNLDDIHKLGDRENLLQELQSKVDDFCSKKELLTEEISEGTFVNLLEEKEQIIKLIYKLYARSSLLLTENTANSEYISAKNSISEKLTHIENQMLFFNLWFKEVSDATALRLIDSSGKYKYPLENMRKFRKYTLSEKEEKIINIKDLTGDAALTSMYNILTNKFRFDFRGETLTQAELVKNVQNKDKETREEAYTTLMKKYEGFSEELGELYKYLITDYKNEEITLRGFSKPVESKLLGDDIPEPAFNALLKVVQNNIGLFQEYFKLKGKLVGLDKMSRFHIYAPHEKPEKEYSYDESKEIVLSTFKKFSEETYNLAKDIFDKEHVHSEITENKRSGAFCYYITTDHAPYIMLNHVNRLDDVFTMAHEFGHGIHGQLARSQTEFTKDATLPLCETASVFAEMLLTKKMLSEATDKEKVYILMHGLDRAYATIIRQSFFTLFELKAHDMIANGTTVEELDETYLANLKQQFGSEIEVPELFKNEWKYIPHIYHTPFYCYSYAFGNLLVLALYAMYEQQGEEFVPKYLKFLSYGGSASPEQILSELGINITEESFWQGGFEVLKKELEELKKLV